MGIDLASVGVRYPGAEQIVLALDRPTADSFLPLGAAFPPTKTTQPTDRIEIRCTPKHGGQSTMAEIERSVLERRLLDRHRGGRRDCGVRGRSLA